VESILKPLGTSRVSHDAIKGLAKLSGYHTEEDFLTAVGRGSASCEGVKSRLIALNPAIRELGYKNMYTLLEAVGTARISVRQLRMPASRPHGELRSLRGPGEEPCTDPDL